VVLSGVALLVCYRKITGDVLWHFDSGCSNWPITIYDEVIAGVPPEGVFCSRCANLCIEKFRFSWITWFVLKAA
jgi:hypothetical protein